MLRPAAAARSTTSKVAIMVVAMPRTGVEALPDLMVSTVGSRQGTPTFLWMRWMTSPAVRVAACDCAAAEACTADAAAAPRANWRREILAGMVLTIMSDRLRLRAARPASGGRLPERGSGMDQRDHLATAPAIHLGNRRHRAVTRPAIAMAQS